MELYLIVSAIVLAVSAGMTFATKNVSSQQFVICLLIFPVIYIASGLPLMGITSHLLLAAAVFAIGFYLAVKRTIGGGVARAFTIAALWIPTPSVFFEYITFTLIFTGIIAAILMAKKSRKSERIDHFAAIAMAICSGFFIFQYTENSPAGITSHEVQARVTTPLSSSSPPALRGSSE